MRTLQQKHFFALCTSCVRPQGKRILHSIKCLFFMAALVGSSVGLQASGTLDHSVAQKNTTPSPLTSAHAERQKIVILGDSLTDGYGIDQDKAFPALVEKSLKAEGYNIQIVNGGISGSTSASAVSRARWFLKSKPYALMITLGSNDGLRGVAVSSLKDNLKQTIRLAKEQNVIVWLAGMKMPPNYGKEYTTQFEQTFEQVAREEKVPLLPFLLDGVAGNPKLNQPDAIHPNEDGHALMAKRVSQFIKGQMQK
jgi:acyl-CoA thioesterase-1